MNIIGFVLAMLAITGMWRAWYVTGKYLAPVAGIESLLAARTIVCVFSTPVLFFSGLAPLLGSPESATSMYVNAFWFGWAVWTLTAFALLGRFARRGRWTAETTVSAFALAAFAPAFAITLFMFVIKFTGMA